MKQETPIQKLIAELKKQKDILKNHFEQGKWNDDRCSEIDNSIQLAESLLPYEREVIENFAKKYFLENRHDQQKITEVMLKANIESEFEETFKTE